MMGDCILSVGLVCLDVITVCHDYPNEDTDQRAKSQVWKRGGNASTTAFVISSLGAKAEFYGTIPGKQKPKSGGLISTQFVLQDLKNNGVDISNLVKSNCEDLPVSIVLINDKNGSRTIVHHRGDLPEISYDNFCKLDLAKYCWIHFEGRTKDIEEAKLFMQRINAFNEKNAENKIKISLEMEKPAQKLLLDLIKCVDVGIVSKDYAMSLGHSNALSAAENILKLCGPNACVVVPWGEDGAAFAYYNEKIPVSGHCPAVKPKEVKDTLGAGDVFIGALIHQLSMKRGIKESTSVACKVASCKISNFGFDCLKNIEL